MTPVPTAAIVFIENAPGPSSLLVSSAEYLGVFWGDGFRKKKELEIQKDQYESIKLPSNQQKA